MKHKLSLLLDALESRSAGSDSDSVEFVSLNQSMKRNIVGGTLPSTNATCRRNPTCGRNESCVGNDACDANQSCSGNANCGGNEVCNGGCSN